MITIMARVKRMRSRSSGIFQVLANAEIMADVVRKASRVYIHDEEARKRFLIGNQEMERKRLKSLRRC